MALSNNLISEFVKATKDTSKNITETIVYGTVQKDVGKVKIDGSDIETPVTTTIVLAEGDRVTVMLKNHEAVVTGNLSSPAARNKDTVKTIDIEAQNARIDKIDAAVINVQNTLTAVNADIGTLKADNATINGTLSAHTASIGTLETNTATITGKITAAEGEIESLKTGKLSASDIEGKYANIDFSNITKATMKEFYAESGIIKDIVLQNGVITGELSGITISGDLIKANTLIANKLVIQGEDGLYYRLNTDGVKTEAQQTDQNSLNGTIIKAKSVTASKINVTDLQAFGATIGGFKISENSIYSGVKSSPSNTTSGIYLGSDGQLFFGDDTNYIKYIVDANGNSKLQIAADSITFGNNGSVMYYRAKDVGTTNTGDAFKFTSGNDIASNNTTSVWLFGGADSTSRFIGSYMAYNRTYSSAANMYVTANGLFGRSTSSSQRYKEDITIADVSCFSGLYNLPVKKFKYKSGYLCGEDERCGQYLYGFVVEDLVDVLPCAVEHITNESGESVPEMWNSNIIIPALLKLIQDLNTRVQALEGAN